ncbi:MAG: hypothetical protein FJ293_03540 [Planctomycetes bacterium]|nr:hypothetical protein [Planctomycetota bacterium]
MRRLGFALSLLAAAAATTIFFTETRATLRSVHALRQALARDLDLALATAERHGAAPSSDELALASSRRRAALEQSDTLAVGFWQGAHEPSDYLLTRAARGGERRDDRRALLDDALLALQVDVKEVPGLSPTRLGLVAPSLSRAAPLDEEALAEQFTRVVAVRLLALTLRRRAPLDLQSATLTFEQRDRLVARVTVVGSIDQLVGVIEELAAPSADAPPRSLRNFTLRRQEPEEWRLTGPQFTSPPACLDATLCFLFPGGTEASR